jgi:hypothetical protein
VSTVHDADAASPAPDAAKPQASVHLQLARSFYFARMEELKEQITMYEIRFA